MGDCREEGSRWQENLPLPVLSSIVKRSKTSANVELLTFIDDDGSSLRRFAAGWEKSAGCSLLGSLFRASGKNSRYTW